MKFFKLKLRFVPRSPPHACNYVFFLIFTLFVQFIGHLTNQLARHQFLKIACQLEKKTMLGAFSLLKVIELELQGYLSATKGRVVNKHLTNISLFYHIGSMLIAASCFPCLLLLYYIYTTTSLAK